MRSTYFAFLACALGVFAAGKPAFAAFSASNAFPDPTGYYESVNTGFYPTPYGPPPGLVTLEGLYMNLPTGSIAPPLAPGATTWSGVFNATTFMSFFGGPTVINPNFAAPCDILITGTSDVGPVHTYDVEMLSLSLTGLPGSPLAPPDAMIRESPTLASLGQHTIVDLPGGGYSITSFFDVFTELSLDGGATWHPASGPPVHIINPEPTSIGLLAFAVPFLFRRRAA